MKELLLLKDNNALWLSVQKQIADELAASKNGIKIKITHNGKRSLGQNAFIHVIFTEISKYLVSKGRTDCDPDWVKKMLKSKYLGWIDETFVDVVTGERTEHQVLRKTSKLDKCEAFEFTSLIIDWADSIGCMIKIPEESEHMELIRSQNL